MKSPEDGTAQSALVVRDVSKQFKRSQGDIVHAIDDVSLEVGHGEIVVLLGPSGCGKTTLLRSVAGLERPDSGVLTVSGHDVFSTAGRKINTPTEKRNLSMMFQSYALWPHMDVATNVGYPLRMRKLKKAVVAQRVKEALVRTGIGGLGDEYPHQLSGGQQQRVALARAIIAESPLVLFDEPLSNVDAKVRMELRVELIGLQAKLGFAALYVTHDQGEAMEMGHRIAVMRQGKIAQLGTSKDIYERPVSRYVANFVGAVNELDGTVSSVENGNVIVDTPVGRLVIPIDPSVARHAGEHVIVAFRPEWARVEAADKGTGGQWKGTIERVLYLGTHAEAFVRVGDNGFKSWVAADNRFEVGDDVGLVVPPERLRILADDETQD